MESTDSPCPICETSLSPEWRTAHLDVWICRSCGHRIAKHLGDAPRTTDYHEQYESGAFVDALAETRRRQARKILDFYHAQAGTPGSWLDFGCGRGWFLEAAHAREWPGLSGADTSALALSWLAKIGILGIPCRIENAKLVPETPPDFGTEVISFLDVLEHFEPRHLISNASGILAGIPRIQRIVVKVPISTGVLYRLANIFRRLGWEHPMEQMYQVGTFPPHWHYFSRRSLSQFLRKLGLNEEASMDDRDFDSLSRRLTFKRPLPAWCGKWIDSLAMVLSLLIGGDTRIVLAKIPIESQPFKP